MNSIEFSPMGSEDRKEESLTSYFAAFDEKQRAKIEATDCLRQPLIIDVDFQQSTHCEGLSAWRPYWRACHLAMLCYRGILAVVCSTRGNGGANTIVPVMANILAHHS